MSKPPRSPPRKPSEINKKAIPRVHYPKINTSIARKAYVYYEPELPLAHHIGRFEIYEENPPELPLSENIERFHVTESLKLPSSENIGRFHVTESVELPRSQNIGRFHVTELEGRKSKGWSKEKPSYYERTVMLKRCGRKCFLGPGKSFPVCKKRTCTVSQRGVHAAYGRARQWKHTSVAKKARRLFSKDSLKKR